MSASLHRFKVEYRDPKGVDKMAVGHTRKWAVAEAAAQVARGSTLVTWGPNK